MISLMLAILSSALVSILMKIASKHIQYEMMMFSANYVICFLLALCTSKTKVIFEHSEVAIGLGIISGILYLASFMLMKFNMKENGVVLTSTFMKLGVIIPTLSAIVIFHEALQKMKILGICIALIAIVIFYYEKDQHFQGNKIWLIILLVAGGITDSMAQFYDQYGSIDQESVYLFTTFFIACLCAVALSIYRKEHLEFKDIVMGAMIGIPNYCSSKFLLQALVSMDAMVVYPMYSILTLVVIAISGVILFKEKLNVWKILAISLVIVAIWMLNQ